MKDWNEFFEQEEQQEYYQTLMKFLDDVYGCSTVFPPREDLFTCFQACSFDQVKVVMLGQDPYHEQGQAHGLCFSVRKGIKVPPSLRNMYKELKSDLGIDAPTHGYLMDWAKQGVFMMNAVMSVEEGKAGSHAKHGWETFSDHAIQALNEHETGIVFLLWGAWAQRKAELITNPQHKLIMSAHPSPLSASRGFLGSKPFSKTNDLLTELNRTPINWKIEE